MNETTVLEEAAAIIAQTPAMARRSSWLCVQDRQLVVIVGPVIPIDAFKVFELNYQQMTRGLKPETWNKMEGKLRKLIKEGLL